MRDHTPLESVFDKALRRVMLTLPEALAENSFPVKNSDGEHPMVIALPSERVEDVQNRIEAAGGSVNLFVAYPDHLVLAAVTPGTIPGDHVDVHPNANVAMLIEWLRAIPTQTGSFSITVPAQAPVVELEYAESAK